MGRRTGTDDGNLMLDQTTRLALNATNDTVSRFTGGNLDSTRNASIVFIDQSTTGSVPNTAQPRKFSLSDRFGGYPENDIAGVPAMPIDDGFVYTAPHPALDEVDDLSLIHI